MLHYFDRASMAHSLEVRVPFLDHHVVEFCATIPPRAQGHGGWTTKYVLKQAARGLIPDRIIDKPKVGFFNACRRRLVPAQTQGAISDYLLGPNPRYAEILDRRRVEELVRAARGRPRDAQRVRAALDPDARGLAVDVPPARSRQPVAAG